MIGFSDPGYHDLFHDCLIGEVQKSNDVDNSHGLFFWGYSFFR